eukprot:CAMPEP_0184484956 /NCGR_PEP_ID=MMETSP0113_2-20130426/6619_1 /TAXON_ID=91329 /ORGANISM="Norrisiella sphaerica, Strain BC52" /LENGTH=513 /DNA_ID=CAMNT_0026866191 /DNA_START=93 /DNA_END=1634 /DNA_ORIENTATION=+
MVEPARYGSLDTYVKEQESMTHPGEDTRCFCCSWNVPVVFQPVWRYSGKCDRACTHCIFCLQFLGCCVILSTPRLACIFDLFIILIIYLGPMRQGTDLATYFAEEAWPYDFERSSLLVVVLSVVRSTTLFVVFAERRQEWTIALSTSMLLLTFGFIGAKIAVSFESQTHKHVEFILAFSIIIATIEYVLYWLVGRRRVVMHPRAYSAAYMAPPGSNPFLSTEFPITISSQKSEQLDKALRDLADDDSKFIQIQKRDIHYKVEKGERKEGDLILIHDFGSSLFSWKECLPHLKKKARHIIMFDIPGFGLSCRPKEYTEKDNPYREEFWLKVLFSLMDRHRIKTATLVGHGMGGALAIIAASEQPKRVSKLILVAPTVYREYIPASIQPFLTTPSLLKMYYSKYQEQSFFERKAVTRPHDEDKQSLMYDIENWDVVIFELHKPNRRYSVKAILPNLELPVTIIHGRQDKMVPFSDSELALENFNSLKKTESKLIPMENCGHVPHEELPEDFAQLV